MFFVYSGCDGRRHRERWRRCEESERGSESAKRTGRGPVSRGAGRETTHVPLAKPTIVSITKFTIPQECFSLSVGALSHRFQETFSRFFPFWCRSWHHQFFNSKIEYSNKILLLDRAFHLSKSAWLLQRLFFSKKIFRTKWRGFVHSQRFSGI